MADDLRSLRQLLRQAIDASGLTIRAIEAHLGIRHGWLDRLLDGRSELRVRHLLAVARLLKVPPQDFLALGCPGAQEEAKHRLKDWIEPPPFGPKRTNGTEPETAELLREAVREALAQSASPSREELVEIIRSVVREELDAPRGRTGGGGRR